MTKNVAFQPTIAVDSEMSIFGQQMLFLVLNSVPESCRDLGGERYGAKCSFEYLVCYNKSKSLISQFLWILEENGPKSRKNAKFREFSKISKIQL